MTRRLQRRVLSLCLGVSLLTALQFDCQGRTINIARTQAPRAAAVVRPPFRPPAVPLVTSDPYLSTWSEADKLSDATTVHWTQRPQPLVSLIRVDGKTFRLMGIDPASVPALPQTALQVTPTRSIYQFQNGQVHVTLTFMTAALPDDLNVLTRPLSYITWQVRSVDGAAHAVSLYDSASSRIAVDNATQPVTWERRALGPLITLRIGTASQRVLGAMGDDARIDWGWLYLAAQSAGARAAIGGDKEVLARFVAQGTLPAVDDARKPRSADDDDPTLAVAFDLGTVRAADVSRHVEVAYDEINNVEWFGTPLRPYWRRGGTTLARMLEAADRDYPKLTSRCAAFDQALTADLTRVGGAKYAQVAALAYRQSLAACGISVDAHGQPLLFTKENTSNGDIATVDVLFPTSPVFLLLNPDLAEASAVPILTYAASSHWKFPNAPHDLGTYPIAFGRDDGGEAMPVEESGNMLLLCDGIAQAEGSADFVKPWWPLLTQWAQFLQQYGEDPGDQLCTDDFMGHLNHNANLSVKAIIALAAYGDLCRMRGDTQTADQYQTLARGFAQHWVQVADQGNASLLAFDKPGTWSQKYNMAWDKILGLGVFPSEVRQKEIAFYKAQLQPLGLPLDSRTPLGDTDHSFFCASLADDLADFEALTTPFYNYLTQTTARLPMADTYVTNDFHSSGMHARSVVGGVFMPMLADRAVWRKWARSDKAAYGGWAPLPAHPVMPLVPPHPTVTYIVPNEQNAPVMWKYATTANPPPADWFTTGFDDSQWKTGPGAFGTPAAWTTVRTPWTDTPGDLWLRRTFVMPPGATSDLKFMVWYDEDARIYVNGILAAAADGYNDGFDPLDISSAARAQLKTGAAITLAVHVHQTTGGQGVDLGLANVTWPPDTLPQRSVQQQSVQWKNAPVNTAESFTVTAWVKLSSLHRTQTFVSQDGHTVSGFLLQKRADNHFAFAMPAADSADAPVAAAVSDFAPTPGQWYQITGVCDRRARVLRLYADGMPLATTPLAGAWQATGLTAIGRDLHNGAHVDSADGDVQAVHLFPRALSNAQVDALYQDGLAKFSPHAFTWTNPIYFQGNADQDSCRDPQILNDNGTYYLVFTMWPFANYTDRNPSKPNDNSAPGIALYASRDLKAWKFVSWVVKSSDVPDDAPYKNQFWAPELHKINGRYFCIFGGSNWLADGYNIGGHMGYYQFVGVAGKVGGPYGHFTALQGPGVDTSLFQDDDGKTYVVWPRNEIHPVDLTQIDKGVVTVGPKLSQPGTDADYAAIGEPVPDTMEGPYMIKHDGTYYCFFAETYRGPGGFYDTEVATAKRINGPWTLDPRWRIFPGGHQAEFVGPDGRWWASFRHEESAAAPWLSVDPIDFDPQGNVHLTPTLGPQSAPLSVTGELSNIGR